MKMCAFSLLLSRPHIFLNKIALFKKKNHFFLSTFLYRMQVCQLGEVGREASQRVCPSAESLVYTFPFNSDMHFSKSLKLFELKCFITCKGVTVPALRNLKGWLGCEVAYRV